MTSAGGAAPATSAGEEPAFAGGASSLAARIGRRLRDRRKELGLTLAETAGRSGMSISFLSAVEKGVNLPSLQTLVKLTGALETTMPTVLVEEGANRVHHAHLPLTPGSIDLAHGELQLRSVAIACPAGARSMLTMPTKDHDVFCFVLEGALEVVLDDRDAVTLHAGDALDVRSASAVRWSSAAGAVVVWTSCPIRV